MSPRGRGLATVSCVLVWLGSGVGWSTDKPVARIDSQAVVRVDRFLYPVSILPTHDAAAGECDHIGPEELRVKVRSGTLNKVESLDRIRLRTLHAVLIDNSASMDVVGRLDTAKRVAQQYVRGLGGASAMVFSGHEETLLVQPETSDGERAAEAIASIGRGSETRLWNSIFLVLSELSLHPEPQKVLTVITDLGFTDSLHSQSDVVQLLEEDRSLGLFVIGLGPESGTARDLVDRAVSISGGETILIAANPQPKAVTGALERIRAWTRRRGVLSVSLSPDAEDTRPDVKVETIAARCRLRVEPVETPRPRRPLGPARPIDSVVPLLPLKVWSDAYREQAEPLADPGCGTDGFVRLGRDRLVGCMLDVSAQEGMLYHEGPPSKVGVKPRVELKTKSFLSFVPALESWPTDPYGLLDQIGRFTAAAPGELLPPVAHPLLIDGETFLAEQPWIGYALLQYPDYRKWATERLREDLSGEISALVQEFRSKLPAATAEWTEEEIARLAESAALASPEGHRMEARRRDPESRDLQGYVSAWLGDIPAQRLFLVWEERWIREYLADPSPELVAKARERWARARRWLALPRWNRVVAPLLLTYDAERRRVGSWRIVLPQASFIRARTAAERKGDGIEAEVPYDLIPRDPLGLLAVEQWRKQANATPRDYEVRVRYELDDAEGTPVTWYSGGAIPECPYDQARVEVTIESTSIRARFAYDPRKPAPFLWAWD